MEDEIEKRDKKPELWLFGRDVTKIPCFRSSWLYGVSSGIGAGILTFMFTSRTALASHMVMGTMSVVTLTYFVVCRYQFAKDQTASILIKRLMQDTFNEDGAEQSKKIEEITKLLDA